VELFSRNIVVYISYSPYTLSFQEVSPTLIPFRAKLRECSYYGSKEEGERVCMFDSVDDEDEVVDEDEDGW
jgi:hypothetical protein